MRTHAIWANTTAGEKRFAGMLRAIGVFKRKKNGSPKVLLVRVDAAKRSDVSHVIAIITARPPPVLQRKRKRIRRGIWIWSSVRDYFFSLLRRDSPRFTVGSN